VVPPVPFLFNLALFYFTLIALILWIVLLLFAFLVGLNKTFVGTNLGTIKNI